MRTESEPVTRAGIVFFVLGMHRSGTSLVTRLLESCGCQVPQPVLDPNPDNPEGYSEPKVMVRANNRMLAELGSNWADDRAFPAASAESVFAHWHPVLLRLSRGWLRRDRLLVLKDPRLCRVFPAWRRTFADLGVDARVVLVVRHPADVARSLARRYEVPEFRGASIIQKARAELLWLRHILDAERHSRGLPRCLVTYEQIRAGELGKLGLFMQESRLVLPDPALVRRSANSEPNHEPPFAAYIGDFYEQLVALASTDRLDEAALQAICDESMSALATADCRYDPLRQNPLQAPIHDPWAEEIVFSARPRRNLSPAVVRHVLFVSGAPGSRGHIYRVEHSAQALASRGIKVTIQEHPSAESLREDTTAVLIFRAGITPELTRLLDVCRLRGIPCIYDIDDAVFEPSLMTPTHFDYLRNPKNSVQQWQLKARDYNAALTRTDAVFVTTDPLATIARRYHRNVYVVPNGLGPDRLHAPQHLPSGARPRIGYASGTPTHQRDFRELADALIRVLKRYPSAEFCVVGQLDIDEFPALHQVSHQICRRPLVAFADLPMELARFDINLAPLQPENPFCESKSELKYFEAAIVGVPTIASPTEPLKACIHSGLNGYLAANEADWEQCLGELIENPKKRIKMGQTARSHALARFGPEHRAEIFVEQLARVLNEAAPTSGAPLQPGVY